MTTTVQLTKQMIEDAQRAYAHIADVQQWQLLMLLQGLTLQQAIVLWCQANGQAQVQLPLFGNAEAGQQ